MEQQDLQQIKEVIKEEVGELALMTKKGFDEVGERFDEVGERFEKLEGRFDTVEATMVTKEYLDEKIADLKGDLVVLIRKEDNKLKKLVEILRAKNVLVDEDVKEILKLEPFSKLIQN